MKLIKYIILLLPIFISSCAGKSNINITVDNYEYYETRLNNKIKSINNDMINTIKKSKNSINYDEFDIKSNLIKIELDSIVYTAKEMSKSISSNTLKKYHNYNIKMLEIQAEYSNETIRQYRNGGEFGGNSAKKTQIFYNTKLRKIKKEQDKLIKELDKEKKELEFLK